MFIYSFEKRLNNNSNMHQQYPFLFYTYYTLQLIVVFFQEEYLLENSNLRNCNESNPKKNKQQLNHSISHTSILLFLIQDGVFVKIRHLVYYFYKRIKIYNLVLEELGHKLPIIENDIDLKGSNEAKFSTILESLISFPWSGLW